MNPHWTKLITGLLLCTVSSTVARISPEQAALLPTPADKPVNFIEDIKPLFEASCVKCHGRGKSKGGFRLDTRDEFLKGGDEGPSIIIGKSAESYLIELVSGLNDDKIMPEKGSRLTPTQISLLRAWIDQGAAWPAEANFAKPAPLNLVPRRPPLPQARQETDLTNPIDLFLKSYFDAHNISPPLPVDDRAFARRVYLDVIGLLPPPEELRAFLSDQQRDKRNRLVSRLLADNQRYAEHWLTFWNDLLRNDYKGTGFIDSGREQISYWLFAALAENLPFDQFVSQLISPGEDSRGFTKGIVWRGVVNASQVPPMQAAQNISQVFMGVNLKCASCHDSFINDWTLAEAYGLASIYADEPLELFKCDKPTGQKAVMKFIYPELGDIDASLPKDERLKQLAGVITAKDNGRLTRAIVNRLWAKLMGRGLVEPVDDLENPAWHQDLLDWLAADLADNGYDLKRTLEWILTSRAYQLPAVDLGEGSAKDFVFRGPGVRRLSAEQFRDGLATLTGVWFTIPAAPMGLPSSLSSNSNSQSGGTADAPLQPRWIWREDTSTQDATDGTVYFRKVVTLRELPTEAAVLATCDDGFTLYVNGQEVTSSKELKKPKLVDIREKLVKGDNLFAISARNEPPKEEKKEANKDEEGAEEKAKQVEKPNERKSNPAGFILYARIRQTKPESPDGEGNSDVVTDSSWIWTTAKFSGWEKLDFEPQGWVQAADLGEASLEPWHLERKLGAGLSAAAQYGRTRAALVAADPLMVALGRPNREQVITTRAAAATTLQALELTNGSTLAGVLKRGAEKIAGHNDPSSAELIERLYLQALSRKPSSTELDLALEVTGAPPQKEGVEDLLWALTMLPEFQLIY
jgi:hypothetical protein